MPVAEHEHFAYHQSMHVEPVSEVTASGIAAAIGEPARAHMLYCLLDGRARTSTELAVVADVTASTASVHLQRLKTLRLVKVFAEGKHRYDLTRSGTRALGLGNPLLLAVEWDVEQKDSQPKVWKRSCSETPKVPAM